MLKWMVGFYETRIRPRQKKLVIGVLAFFLLFTLIGFFLLPPVLKSILVKEISKNLHRETTIHQIRFNPYTLSTTVRGVTIKDRAGKEIFFSCDEIFLNVQTLSVLRLALVLKEVKLMKPYLKVIRNEDESYNFSDLLEKKAPPPKVEKSSPLKFSVNNIIIRDGSIDFFDGPKGTKHTIREMMVGVPFLSNMPAYVETFVQPHFSARINDTLYAVQGKTKPFADSLESSIDVSIKDFNIPYYLAYLPMKLNFRIASAFLDMEAKISFIQTKDKRSILTVTGETSLKKVAIDDMKGLSVFRLPLLQVAISPSEPLSQRIHLSKILIQEPELDIRRDKEGVINYLTLMPKAEEKGPGKSAAPAKGVEVASQLSLEIDQVRLTGGKVSFSDLSGDKPFKTVVSPLDLKVDHFSNGKEKKTAYALSMETEAKETVKVEGQLSVDPLASEGILEVASVVLKKYAPYYGDKVLFDIEEGRLDFSTRFKYAQSDKEPLVDLSGMAIALNALRLKKPEEKGDFLKIPNLTIKESELSLTKRELKIGSFLSQKGEVFVKRFEKGDVNLLNLLPPAPTAQETGATLKGTEAKERPLEPAKPWTISVKQLLIDNYAIQLEDRTTPSPATLTVQKLRVKGDNISTARNSKGRVHLSLLLNEKGTVSLAGSMAMEPLAADLKVWLAGLEIAPFQPYFRKKVRMTVTGGAVSTEGSLSIRSAAKGPVKALYKGDASITGFSSVDRQSGGDLLKFESLSFSDMNVGYEPLSVDIGGVSLTNFYALVAVSREGRINLQQMMAADQEPPAPMAAPASTPQKSETPVEQKEPAKDIKIRQVTLQGGEIDFSDKSVKPEFAARLGELGGRVSGLSSEANTTADVEVRAKLNDYAPLEITGKINPLADNLYADIKARIKDLDLSPATPYAGKYAGYAIEKGKLSLDVQYSIVNRKLNSQNNIFIDQFNFGERVESPQATKLPVRLAVALLKDRKGEIKLDLPVTGSLDDPQFSVWKVVWKIIVNLIAKAATSPFALLGALFGGGEELGYVEFDYGTSNLTESGLKKLATVSKALYERPALKLDVEGHVDRERDKDGLKQILFLRKVKAQKLNEVTKKGETPPPVDEVKIQPAEYEKYLKMAYKREKFPKPKNFIGLAKDIPVPEMEKLMLTHTEVTDSDLRVLASQRALNVRDAVAKSGQVEPGRVFIIEPKSLAPEKKEKARESRVDLKLE